MVEHWARQAFDRYLIEPVISKVKHARSLTPIRVSVLSLSTGSLAAMAIYYHLAWTAVALLLVSGYLDTFDGALSRATNRTSDLGAVVDIMADRLVEAFVILALTAQVIDERALAGLWMFLSVFLCVSSFLVVGIFSDNRSHKQFHYSPGLMERPEAFCFFITMTLLPEYFLGLAYAFVFLVLVTTFLRLKQFAAQATKSAN